MFVVSCGPSAPLRGPSVALMTTGRDAGRYRKRLKPGIFTRESRETGGALIQARRRDWSVATSVPAGRIFIPKNSDPASLAARIARFFWRNCKLFSRNNNRVPEERETNHILESVILLHYSYKSRCLYLVIASPHGCLA
jgi:hypothetical protein